MLHLGRLQPYPQTSDLAGKACQGQRFSSLRTFVSDGSKMFHNIGQCYNTFYFIADALDKKAHPCQATLSELKFSSKSYLHAKQPPRHIGRAFFQILDYTNRLFGGKRTSLLVRKAID